MTQDIPVDTIVKYRLGRLVKVVRNRAIRNLNKSIADSSTEVMDKWRRLLTEGYSSAENQQQPTASLRLPVEKDAPTTVTGPKTAGNKTAFELSNAPSFFSRTTSQQHQQQQQQTDMTTFLQQSNTAHIKNSISKCLSAKSSKSRTTQRVRFKPDHQFVTVQKRHVDTCREKAQNKQPLVQYDSWYPPRSIQIPDSCRLPCQEKVNSTTSIDNIVTPILTVPYKCNRNTKIIPLFEIDTIAEPFSSGVVNTSSSYTR
ncbi:unnamed protein product [Absidia cylindrospora]